MRLIPHRVGEPTTFTATCDNITATDSVGRNGASLGIRDRLDWCCAKGARFMPFRTRSGFFSVALLFALTAGASAQDGYHGQGHAENHDWYRDLKQPGTGYSCCNGTADGRFGDCRPTRAYLTEDGSWRAMVNGRWVRVPPHAVLKQLAPDGNSHICASPSGVIYCFLGGSPKS